MGRYANHAELGVYIEHLLKIVLSKRIPVKAQTKKQFQKRLRTDEILELREAYKAGRTVYELAERFSHQPRHGIEAPKGSGGSPEASADVS